MMLEQGTMYRATIELGFLERIASNEVIAEKFREVGFVDVTVTGSGGTREATGRWPLDSRDVDLPKQVTEVSEV